MFIVPPGESASLMPMDCMVSKSRWSVPCPRSAEAGGVILREVIERLGIGRFLANRLQDPRRPELITHPLIEFLHTELIMLGQGWRDEPSPPPLVQETVAPIQ